MRDTPSWSYSNHFTSLYTYLLDDNDDDDSISVTESVCEMIATVVAPKPPQPSPKPPPTPWRRLKHWERRLPRKLVISSDSSHCLTIPVELESTINASLVSGKALVDSGATSMGYADAEFVNKNSLPT